MKSSLLKIVVVGFLIFFTSLKVVAQDTLNSQSTGGKRVNSITTTVAFLLITPDSRHGVSLDRSA